MSIDAVSLNFIFSQVEQMHKIFKLCGSPTEDYWRKTKLPQTTSFKQHYKRIVAEAFKRFPSEALSLVDKLLSLIPRDRGTAVSALRHEVKYTPYFFNS